MVQRSILIILINMICLFISASTCFAAGSSEYTDEIYRIPDGNIRFEASRSSSESGTCKGVSCSVECDSGTASWSCGNKGFRGRCSSGSDKKSGERVLLTMIYSANAVSDISFEEIFYSIATAVKENIDLEYSDEGMNYIWFSSNNPPLYLGTREYVFFDLEWERLYDTILELDDRFLNEYEFLNYIWDKFHPES